MTRIFRPRQLVTVALAAVFPLVLAACNETYPNSTFQHTTEFNRDLTSLWNQLIGWGLAVFVLVEGILIYAIWRYRRRPDSPEPKHVHGNTTLEIAWTLIPALILVFIAVPTVRNIWKYQAEAVPEALQVEVIGHQWWWEFRYPQYNITTANELYLPLGRTVNFALRTGDVLHSFWIPALGGKRDLISNRVNYLWFTPDSAGTNAWMGSCNEYCGTSHANMRFRAFTVPAEDFERWAAHQARPAVFPSTPATPSAPAVASATPVAQTTPPNAAPSQPQPAAPLVDEGYVFPREQLPAYIVPDTPIPNGLTFPEGLVGDPQRGFETYSRSACIGCHKIEGNRSSVGVIGPNLTHIASRHTIAGGLFPNDTKHMALWIKNSRRMKPGVLMNTLGKDEYDPIRKARVTVGGLTDQQIADIVAYMQTLK